MSSIALRIVSVLAVSAILGILIGGVCTFFPLPRLGDVLPVVLGVGVLLASLIGGYIGYRAPAAETKPAKVRIDSRYATLAAVLTLILSLFVILNTHGS